MLSLVRVATKVLSMMALTCKLGVRKPEQENHCRFEDNLVYRARLSQRAGIYRSSCTPLANEAFMINDNFRV